ncbi:FecR domain-containing protein [Reichenbachiella sp. MALMAid0571]|uniref:FecR family protein n=1 Tax=Reichenbachiella sp. MALMAid0571 TaxID=3143939 RepID=UPI0032E04085
MNYKNYHISDFIKDEYFVHWVKYPDKQSDTFWNMWIDKNPEKREELMHAKNMIIDLGYKYDPKLTEDDYVEMFEGVLKRSRNEKLKNRNLVSLASSKVFKVAAVLAVILVSVFLLMEQQRINIEPSTELNLITKKNPLGQKTITWLEDGTKVHLNSGSSIQYPGKFSDSSRVVYIKGEAYFEVTKDSSRPFIVKTEKIQTTVLGTVFNVRAYPDETKVNVAVEEGRVKVESEKSASNHFEHIIVRNQMTSFDIKSQKAVKTEITSDEVFAWTKGIIDFREANINEIIRTLERWYGVTFVVNCNLNLDKDFTYSYKNKPLKEILTGLGFAFNFEFEMKDKTITLN